MATIGNTNPTLLDIARRTDPDGKVPEIIELLEQDNEILKDMTYQEANQGETNKTTIRTGLPSAYWRRYNQGVPKSKSTTASIVDHCAMLEARSELDQDEVDGQPSPQEYRFSEDVAFLSAMNNKMAETVFYGDMNTPESFVGLAPRFAKLGTGDETKSSFNVLDGGSENNNVNTSIFLCGWGARTGFGIIPRGSKAGFQHIDRGIQTCHDRDGNDFEGYVSVYKWKNGLCIRDWRYFGRIANIDTTALYTANATDLVEKMIRLAGQLPTNRAGVRFAFYVCKSLHTALRLQVMNQKNVNLSLDDFDGKKILHVDGIPIRTCEAIRKNEKLVTA